MVPMSWHNICFFIVTYELCRSTCIGRTLAQVYTVQRAPSETADLRWYCFNNKRGFMMAIKKKSKIKNWKYDFLFMRRETG